MTSSERLELLSSLIHSGQPREAAVIAAANPSIYPRALAFARFLDAAAATEFESAYAELGRLAAEAEKQLSTAG